MRADGNAFDTDIGGTFGVVVGASDFFTRHVGINAELGWSVHLFGFDDVDGDSGILAFAEFSLLTVNAMFAF